MINQTARRTFNCSADIVFIKVIKKLVTSLLLTKKLHIFAASNKRLKISKFFRPIHVRTSESYLF